MQVTTARQVAGAFEGSRDIGDESERVRGGAQHGINVRRLYEERRYAARAKAAEAHQRSGFVPVRLKTQPLTKATQTAHHAEAFVARLAMQARLNNGVVLSWTYDASSISAPANLLHTLAGLLCFN